jgi:hypothetical protein
MMLKNRIPHLRAVREEDAYTKGSDILPVRIAVNLARQGISPLIELSCRAPVG